MSPRLCGAKYILKGVVMKKSLVSLSVLGIIFGGCLSVEPSTPAERNENSQKAVAAYTKEPLEMLYGKVFTDPADLEKLNACVAQNIVSKLSESEKYFLGGNATEKAEHKDALSTLKEKMKPNSPEIKESLKVCSVTLSMQKLLGKL